MILKNFQTLLVSVPFLQEPQDGKWQGKEVGIKLGHLWDPNKVQRKCHENSFLWLLFPTKVWAMETLWSMWKRWLLWDYTTISIFQHSDLLFSILFPWLFLNSLIQKACIAFQSEPPSSSSSPKWPTQRKRGKTPAVCSLVLSENSCSMHTFVMCKSTREGSCRHQGNGHCLKRKAPVSVTTAKRKSPCCKQVRARFLPRESMHILSVLSTLRAKLASWKA